MLWALTLAATPLAACAASAPPPPVQAAGEERDSAMVQIVENWALVEGLVENWQPASAGGRAVLTLRVDRVTPVEQATGRFYPNFLEGR